MLKKLLVFAALLAASPSFGQGTVSYVTPVTRNTVPVWNTNGVIAGSVTSADSPVTSFGVTNNGGSGICVNSARAASAGYNALCLGASTSAPATISLQNYGTATAETLNFVINGVTYPFPGALASITVASTPVFGGTNGDCLNIVAGVVNQVPCSILNAATTGTGSVVLNNSPTLAGTIGGTLTFSGNETFTGNGTFGSALIVNGLSTPASAAGNTVLLGTVSAPVLANTGQAFLFNTSIGGATLQGDGSTADISLVNKSGNTALQVLTGTTTVSLPGGLTLSGLSSGTCVNGIGINASNQAITVSCPGAASSIQVGTTTISSGTANNLLYNNAGTLGNGTIASFLTASTGISITGTTNATISLTSARQTLPTSQIFLSGSGTYTTPANVLWIEVYLIGGGSGGGGGQNGASSTAGGSSCWNTAGSACASPVYQAGGGSGSNNAASGAGGTIAGTGTCNIFNSPGNSGASGSANNTVASLGAPGGAGGGSPLLGGGAAGGQTAVTNSGAGGGGGAQGNGTIGTSGSGGSSGGACGAIINSPASTYTYAVGAGGAGASAGSGGSAGSAGASGKIWVVEHYGS